jgi:hypothetical protein
VSSRPAICSACKAKVTWATFPDGVKRPIDNCTDGEGSVALQPSLPGIGGRIEARIVSGVRTSYRLHLDTCPQAHVYRNRWRASLRCSGCDVPMLALENKRSVCAACQRNETARLAELAGEMVERFGVDDAKRKLSLAFLGAPRGKR